MNSFDSNGWAGIHSAAYKGYDTSLEKLVSNDVEQLELRTTDQLQSTPLLLAVMSGKTEIIKLLVNLGAKVHTRNSQGHGIIEIACLRRDVDMLLFIMRDEKIREFDLPITNQLVEFLCCNEDEWCRRTALCLCSLLDILQNSAEGYEFINKLIRDKLIQSITRVLRGPQGMECKKNVLLVFHRVSTHNDVREQFMKQEGMENLLPLLKPPSYAEVALEAIETLRILIREPNGYSEKIFNSGILTDINRILGWVTVDIDYDLLEKKSSDNLDPDEDDLNKMIENEEKNAKLKEEWNNLEMLTAILKFLAELSQIHQAYQNSIGREQHCLERIKKLIHPIKSRHLLIATCICITEVARNNPTNQVSFMNLDIDDYITPIIRGKDGELQMLSVETIHQLCKENVKYCEYLMEKEVHKPILLMLQRAGRNIPINEQSSMTLWALAGQSRIKKAQMANYIGVEKLIDFLQASSFTLQLIGSEGICVLSGGPTSQRDQIGKLNGIAPLVNLLTSRYPEIVLSCVRSLRQVCIKTGYLPHQRNQKLVVLTGGLQVLVGLMRFCENELIQVEAAYTTACVTMRNHEAMVDLHANPKFNYIYILEKMYSNETQVRLLAGAGLAAFAYNNIGEQRQIAMCGGVRYGCLRPFLDVSDEYERIMSAFQMVVLARVIPDEELAISTATALQILITTLQNSNNPDVQELGCDCVARLCHTRAGIAAGMVEMGIVDVLSRLMLSYIEAVRGSAAIAIQYLSHYPESRRQILRKCRHDPYLMKAVKFYNSSESIDTEFVEGWRHYQKIGLPKIPRTRPPLSTRVDLDLFQGYDKRQLTIFPLEPSVNKNDLSQDDNSNNESQRNDDKSGTVNIGSNYQVLPEISSSRSPATSTLPPIDDIQEEEYPVLDGNHDNKLLDRDSLFEETKLSLAT